MKNEISILAAIGREREIGLKGKIPWHLSKDLIRFKELTTDQVVIMGRKTFESIGKPLPNRLNIVLTRNSNFEPPPGSLKAKSFNEALELVPEGKEAFVIGGSEVFAQALKVADKLYITYVDIIVPEADTYFPEFDLKDWKAIQITSVPANKKNQFNSLYIVYERRK